MICPYCKREMTKGTLSGSGSSMLKFTPQDAPRTILGSGKIIKNAKYDFSRFEIKSYFCQNCCKMIFDAKI